MGKVIRRLTPNFLQLSENFSILGESVESSWPKYLEYGSKQCRAGTSYATTTAAATAANMLFYARMKLENKERAKELETRRGMICEYEYANPHIL
jgi:hypothetical protein